MMACRSQMEYHI